MNSEPSALFSLSFFFVSLLPHLLSYLHSIRGRVQSASLRDVQGRQEEQRGTEQHRVQHGSDDRQQGPVRVEKATAANQKIQTANCFYTYIHAQHKMKLMVILK